MKSYVANMPWHRRPIARRGIKFLNNPTDESKTILRSKKAAISISTNVRSITMSYHERRVEKSCHGQSSFRGQMVVRSSGPTHRLSPSEKKLCRIDHLQRICIRRIADEGNRCRQETAEINARIRLLSLHPSSSPTNELEQASASRRALNRL